MRSTKTPLPALSPAHPDTSRSGRASFDDRGNAVWEWQVQTGVFTRDVETQHLEQLTETTVLEIAETGVYPSLSPAHAPGGGRNPYDHVNAPRRKPAQTALKPARMRELDAQIKARRRAAENSES